MQILQNTITPGGRKIVNEKLNKTDKEFIKRCWKDGIFNEYKIIMPNKSKTLHKLKILGVIKHTGGPNYSIERGRFMELTKEDTQEGLFGGQNE